MALECAAAAVEFQVIQVLGLENVSAYALEITSAATWAKAATMLIHCVSEDVLKPRVFVIFLGILGQAPASMAVSARKVAEAD